MLGVTVLGATGSIGMSTLDVVLRHPQRFRVVALTANRDVKRMLALCEIHQPDFAVMADGRAAQQVRDELQTKKCGTEVLDGVSGLEHVVRLSDVHTVMAAIVGGAGLLPTLAAAQAGKRVLLANKEALVMSGNLFMDTVRRSGAELLPVDSEHNAIFQCMPAGFSEGFDRVGIRRILLTASGGPFRTLPLEALSEVTPEQACAHPNWVMGRKISVDSATMMNKGLEVIEACWLFNTSPDVVQVVLHPQSVVHSMVEYVDGSILAQFGSPDMRTPIAHALAWPERIESGVKRLNIFDVARLDFEPPDESRFPCLRLAYEAIAAGGTATTVLNAANEIAVAAFLEGRLRFLAIPEIIENTCSDIAASEADSLDGILDADRQARQRANELVAAVAN